MDSIDNVIHRSISLEGSTDPLYYCRKLQSTKMNESEMWSVYNIKNRGTLDRNIARIV